MNTFGGPTITNSNLMSVDQITDIINTNPANPVISRMIFIETRKSKNCARKVFPCYPIARGDDDGKAEDSILIAVVQAAGGTKFFVGYINMPVKDIGVTCRFWDMPPTDILMDQDPLPPAPDIPEPDEEVPEQ